LLYVLIEYEELGIWNLIIGLLYVLIEYEELGISNFPTAANIEIKVIWKDCSYELYELYVNNW
jgi:hypothetical protein